MSVVSTQNCTLLFFPNAIPKQQNPVGWWLGAQQVTGDASGGNLFNNLRLASAGDGSGQHLFFSLDCFMIKILATMTGTIELQIISSFNYLGGPTTFSVEDYINASTLLPAGRLWELMTGIKALFPLQKSASSSMITFITPNNIAYSNNFEASGFLYDERFLISRT